jgi:hypothetical protein
MLNEKQGEKKERREIEDRTEQTYEERSSVCISGARKPRLSPSTPPNSTTAQPPKSRETAQAARDEQVVVRGRRKREEVPVQFEGCRCTGQVKEASAAAQMAP